MTETLLNIEELLKPISPDRPSGEDLRYSEVYDAIKEARRSDDLLEQGEWRTDVKTSDWRQVIRLCERALAEKSKDLQIAVWLSEALVHQHGYRGLAAGLEVVRRLMDDFWPTMHPPMEDGDPDYRLGPLTLLNEKLPPAVCHVPLCDPGRSKGYHYYHWEESRLVGSNQDLDKEQRKRREMLIEEGKISTEDFSAAVNMGSLLFYKGLTEHLEQGREALIRLDALVAEKFSPNPPGFGKLREAIDACGHLVTRIFREKEKSEIPSKNGLEAGSEEQDTGVPPLAQNDGDHLDRGVGDSAVIQRNAISDITDYEKKAWQQVAGKLEKGQFRAALDQLLFAAARAPSVREKNRYLLLVAKLCLLAQRSDLAIPIAEELYNTIETLKLEQWEHPAWIAEVVETLYRCLVADGEKGGDRARTLYKKLCLLNVTKAAAHRFDA